MKQVNLSADQMYLRWHVNGFFGKAPNWKCFNDGAVAAPPHIKNLVQSQVGKKIKDNTMHLYECVEMRSGEKAQKKFTIYSNLLFKETVRL